MTTNFESSLASFVAGCQRLVDSEKALLGERLSVSRMRGGKRVKIVLGGHSAWAFVDVETGDLLAPASWNRPAKRARGNIFSANPFLFVNAFGPRRVL
jgi:hypothetical protein